MSVRNPTEIPFLPAERALAGLVIVVSLTWVIWFVSGCSMLSTAIKTVTPTPAPYIVDGGHCDVVDDGGAIKCDTESFRAILMQCGNTQ